MRSRQPKNKHRLVPNGPPRHESMTSLPPTERVSLVVCTLNEAANIAACIKSAVGANCLSWNTVYWLMTTSAVDSISAVSITTAISTTCHWAYARDRPGATLRSALLLGIRTRQPSP